MAVLKVGNLSSRQYERVQTTLVRFALIRNPNFQLGSTCLIVSPETWRLFRSPWGDRTPEENRRDFTSFEIAMGTLA